MIVKENMKFSFYKTFFLELFILREIELQFIIYEIFRWFNLVIIFYLDRTIVCFFYLSIL